MSAPLLDRRPGRPAGQPTAGGRAVRAGAAAHRRSTPPTGIDGLVALVVVMLLGLRVFVSDGLTLGFVAAFALGPVWIPVLRRYRGGSWLALLAVLASVAGAWLTALSSADHAVSGRNMVATSFLLLGAVSGVGVILWARTLVPVPWIAAAFAVGLLGSGVLADGAAANPWKYAFGVPVAVLVLAAVGQRIGASVVALVALAGLSGLLDSRSMFATFLLAAVLVAWQLRPASRKGRTPLPVMLLFGAVLGAAIYNLATTLLVDGALGEEAQRRSIEQIETSGSVLTGGRPEMGATLALLQHRPLGFGSGTFVNLGDIRAAKEGMAALGYQPDNGYVERYMFGDTIKLHSMIGDLWAYFGIAGLVLAVTVGVLVVTGVGHRLGSRTASGLVVYLACATLWNLPFSPLYSSVPVLMLTLGLLLEERQRAGGHQATEPARPGYAARRYSE